MKARRGKVALLFVVSVTMGFVGCGPEVPKAESPKPAPISQSTSVTESAGQAVVDSVKTPLDKSRQVEGTLEKAAEKKADTLKDATQ